MILRFTALLLLVASLGVAQPRLASADSANAVLTPLTLDEYFQAVLLNHPVARQAYLLGELAQQDLRLAQGNFDPALKSNFAIKQFGEKNTTYYNTWDTKLEVPLWFPMDLNVGYERNRGEYLNDELANTDDGLIYAGVTLPLGRGLLVDERRTAIRTGRLMQDIAVADQIKEINKVLLNAAKAYWEWYYAYEAFQVIDEVEVLAETRYEGVVRRVENGDAAPFDSLKAFINYQERDVLRAQAGLEYENAKLTASVYLWRTDDDNAIPLEIADNTVPVRTDSAASLSLEDLNDLQRQARANHPELLKLGAKIQQLQIQQRLNREFLKPVVNLKYNFLANTLNGEGQQLFDQQGIPANGTAAVPWYQNNYRAGVEFYFPLFLRKERAKIAQTRVKLEQNFFERSFVQRAVENEINTAYNTLYNLNTVIDMQQQMVRNYERLLEGELRKFEFGESSIFLINTRETELLDARVKLLKLYTQYEKAKLELQYAAGVPNLVQASGPTDVSIPTR
ncbi:MAG: TolC family protein [Tunicatimonas sp.]